jgi:uncharacterized membrane protein
MNLPPAIVARSEAIGMSVYQRRCFLRDQGGAISIIAALSLMMLLAIAAIVIDVGSLYFARRALQSTNDAAALAAVQDPANASGVAAFVFSQNGYSGQNLAVTTGVYAPDESLSVSGRFTAGSSGVNAVRVIATVQQHNYFASLFGLSNLSTLQTQAIAARVPTASFGVGTQLAELNGGLINSLLGQLTGSSVSLSLVDYQSLLTTDINALTFFNQLATDISVTGDYSQLAGAQVTTSQILNAMTEVAATPGASSGDTAGALSALQNLQLQLQGNTPAQLSDVIDLSSLYGRSIGNIAQGDSQGEQVNLMSLLSAAATTSGSGQTTNIGTAITIPVTGSSVATRLAVGSKMAQVASAKVGTSINTAPIRLALTVTLANVNLGVATANIQVPIYLEAAAGDATLADMPCTVGGTLVDIAATSGATTIQFGSVSDAVLANFSTPVTPIAGPVVNVQLLGIPIQVNISGSVTSSSAGPQTLPFSQDDIDAATVKSVSGGVTAPFNGLSTNFVLTPNILGNPGLLGSLLNSQLDILTAALTPVIANLLAQLDSPSNSLLTTLGLQLGITNIRVFDASCRTPTLEG